MIGAKSGADLAPAHTLEGEASRRLDVQLPQGCVLRLQDGDDVVACLCAGVTCESHAALIAGYEIAHKRRSEASHPPRMREFKIKNDSSQSYAVICTTRSDRMSLRFAR